MADEARVQGAAEQGGRKESPPSRELQLVRQQLEEAQLSLAQTRAESAAHQDAAAAAAGWAEAVSEECEVLRQQLKVSHEEMQSRKGGGSPHGTPLSMYSAATSQPGTPASTPGPRQEDEDDRTYALRCALQAREAEVEALKTDNASLRKELLAAMDSSQSAATDVWDKVNRLNHHLEVINTEIAAERSRAEAAEARSAVLKKDLVKKAAEVNGMRGRALVTENNLRAVEERAQQLSKDLAGSRCQNSRLETELKDTSRRLEYAHTAVAELEDRNAKLNERLSRKMANLASERSKRAALEATMSTLDTVRAELLQEMERFRVHQEFQDKAKDKEVVSRRALRQSATFSWQGSATASLSTSMVEEDGEGEGADAGLGGEVDLATAAAAALEKQMVSQQMRRAYSQASSPANRRSLERPREEAPPAQGQSANVLSMLNRVHRSLAHDFQAMQRTPVEAEGGSGADSSGFVSPVEGRSSPPSAAD